jgi:Rhs element Vgr protein
VVTNLAQDFQKVFADRQQSRLLRLTFPHGDAPYSTLLANRLTGTESLSRDFEFKVEILSDNASLSLKNFQGKMITVELARADGTSRYFNGYIFAFRHVKTDGSVAFYEATIGPWLRFLSLRTNNRLFQDQDLHTQTTTLLQDYGVLPDWDWKVAGTDPVMTMAVQYGESDHNYLHRRWEAAGFYYWYEHTAKSHKLIVSDASINAKQIDGNSASVPFQRDSGSKVEDGLALWSPVRSVMPGQYTVARFDFKSPRPATAGVPTINQQGGVPNLEQYEYVGAYGFGGSQDGDGLSKRRMEEIEAVAKRFEGEGNNRYVMPGRWFELTDHFGHADGSQDDNQFLVVEVGHVASNNYLQGVDAPSDYHNDVIAIRKKIPWRPGRGYNSVDTRIYAPQTATVVGPSGQSVYTDKYGRCRVQFHWDQLAKGDESSSAWVRVATAWAGGDQGFVALPRVGSEVIVQWLEGSPDRPIITGRVHNESNLPSWQLPDQSALMGFRSRELSGANGNMASGRSNHLLFDDTKDQIQTQLRSDHEASQLSLGHITRVEDNTGRQDGRGEGFELRTDSVGAIRSGKGMLISTDARPLAKSHISDINEATTRLGKSQTLQAQLGKLAQQHSAQESGGDQSDVADALQSQNDGLKGSSTGGNGSFPELNEPQLLVASAAGTAVSSTGSTHVASGEHTALTAGSNISLGAGKSIFASASEKLSIFVHRMGMKLIAASGKVQIQAQNDELELLAKKVVGIISTTDWVNITAKQGIRLTAGNSQFVVSAEGINGFTPGGNTIHAASHGTQGPQSIPAQFPGADLCQTMTNSAAEAGSASVPLA